MRDGVIHVSEAHFDEVCDADMSYVYVRMQLEAQVP
jgi:hypothetical protein